MLKIAWSSVYNHPLPANHRFPMIKYDLIPEQLLHEGTINPANLFEPTAPDEKVITRTHDSKYLKRLMNLELSRSEARKTGFPLSADLIKREILIAGGTVQCAFHAIADGVAMNVAGGTHHAFSDRGEGFCLLNDLAIAANQLLDAGLAKRILIIDLDVHQGDGTASIFAGKQEVFTFSMHGERNYPLKKERSHLDVALNDGTRDREYLSLLERHLSEVAGRFQPDFICYQAGVDVLHTDKLGRLSLTLDGCRRRDEIVLNYAFTAGVPLVISMGGGYALRLRDIIEAHANTFRLAQEIYF